MTIFLILAPFGAFALLMLVTTAEISLFVAAAICLAIIGIDVYRGRTIKILGAGGVVLFSGLGAYVALIDPQLGSSAVKLSIDIGMLAISLASLIIRKPFVMQYSLEEVDASLAPMRNTVIVPVSGIHRGVINALRYARSISPESVTAVYVDFEEEATARLKGRWDDLGIGVDLVVLPSPYRELTRPILKFIGRAGRHNRDGLVTVVIPEFVPRRWWQHLLHNQSSLLLKAALLFRRDVVVTNIPYHLDQ